MIMDKKKKTETKGKKEITPAIIDRIDDDLEAVWAALTLMGLAGQLSNRNIETEVAVLSEDLATRVIALKDFIHESLNM
jgi:hypothetical protein